MTRPRVVLADEHVLLLDALTRVLQPEFRVVGRFCDGRALVEGGPSLEPAVAVANLSLPGLGGFEAARRLKRVLPGLHVVLLSSRPDPVLAARAFACGASGYILTSESASALLSTLRATLAGERVLSPSVAGGDIAALPAASIEPSVGRLSPREHEVVQLMAEGRSAKEAAEILGISPRTVFYHKYRAMETLVVRSSAELVRFAVRNGLA
jgi:DNA-binding NarL/FixJ family response regulator